MVYLHRNFIINSISFTMSKKEEIMERIRAIAKAMDALDDVSEIREETLIGSLFDSYRVLELVMELEKFYGGYIFREQEDKIRTFGDLIDVIQSWNK